LVFRDADDLAIEPQAKEVLGVGRIEGDDPREGLLEGQLLAVLVGDGLGLGGAEGERHQAEDREEAEG